MIIPLLLTSSLLFGTPVKDTVWWNTEGGRVLEHRDGAVATCTLWLIDQDSRVAFTWAKGQPVSVAAISPALSMPSDSPRMPVSLQIGDAWLNNAQPYDAVGFGTSLTFVIDQSIEAPLRGADHITIRSPTSDFSLHVNRTKIATLLDHVRQCRQSVPGLG